VGSFARGWRVPCFIGLVLVAACLVIVLAILMPAPPVAWAWWGVLLLFATILASEAGSVELSTASNDDDAAGYTVSVSTIPHIASILLLPPAVAAVLAGAGMLVDEVRGGSPRSRLIFNVSATVLSVGLAGLAAASTGIQGDALTDENGWRVAAFFGVIAVYYIANTLPVVGITSVAGGVPFWPVLLTNLRRSAPAELAVAVVGGLAAHEWAHGPAWVIAGLSPALISQLALRSIAARNRKAQQIASLDRLGRALSSVFSVEEVFEAAGANLRLAGPVAGCFLELQDPPIHLADGAAARLDCRGVFAELRRRCLDTGQPVWTLEPPETPGGDSQAWLTMPLKLGESTGGAFGILYQRRSPFDAEDKGYFVLMAERIAIALENARRAEELTRMAFHDALTGLANRALLLDRLEHALVRISRHGRPVAVLFIDLDNFKLVNDSLGHEAGDRLLQQVAQRLRAATRAEDTLARFGGDEFVVLLEETTDANEARAAADRLAEALRSPMEVEGRLMVVEASLGIAVSGPGRERPADLLRDADLALYRAKTAGKARSVMFEPGFEAAAMERFDLEHALRRALERRELRVFYQPIVSLATGATVGWEALVRWQHPERGLVPPSEFIPIAEETGLIVPIGQWVLEEACKQCRAWQSDPPQGSPLVMSVNLSARQFQQPNLVEEVQGALELAGLAAPLLKLEVTESVVMQDAASASAILCELAGLGVRIAIDDFGTGYSSLAYLKQFPIETLKIDRSFVTGIVTDPHDAAIVRSVVALAKSLNLTVTAEGIETASQQRRLREIGCELGQGYLFGRPSAAVPDSLAAA
jgi:diguanylate cyclase (GGDEF)-like protein